MVIVSSFIFNIVEFFMKEIARSIAVHDGAFHADEVTACALLVFFGLADKRLICRSRDPIVLNKCEYVCDVGGEYDTERKLFDHHQSTYRGELSSAGMVLKFLKEKNILEESFFDALNGKLVLGIDAEDNGKIKVEEGSCSFSDVIANFLPVEYNAGEKEMTKAFYKALDFVIEYLERFKLHFYYRIGCKEKVREAMEKGEKFLIFDKAMPWLESFFELGGKNHPALFLIMPSDNNWKLRAIPPSLEDKMNVRKPLPLKWAGLHAKELKEKSGIRGAIFCHKGRFISIWETKEDALKALEKCL